MTSLLLRIIKPIRKVKKERNRPHSLKKKTHLYYTMPTGGAAGKNAGKETGCMQCWNRLR